MGVAENEFWSILELKMAYFIQFLMPKNVTIDTYLDKIPIN